MHVAIETPAKIGKSFTSKVEKQPDDTDAIIGHLKFADAFVPRELIDELCLQPVGWSQGSFYDELGAPRCRMDISLPWLAVRFSGAIRGVKPGDRLVLTAALLDGITFSLHDNGAKLSGKLTWKVGGDEATDTEVLLGRLCMLAGELHFSGQQDLLSQRAA